MTARSDILSGWRPKAGYGRAPLRWLTPVAILLIIVAGLAVYSPSIDGEFIMDDRVLIVDNPLVKRWVHATELFITNMGAGTGLPFAYYRPLQMFSYLINYHFWQLDVRTYHAVNIFLHLMAALSLFWLAGLLARDRMLSLATALLFVVHPVQAESVAYISGRGDCLVGLFVLLTTACYVKYLEKGHRPFYGLTLLCLVAALFSKETGVVLPGVLVLCHVYYRKPLKSFTLAGTFVVTLSYLAWYLMVMRNVAGDMRISRLPDRIPGIFAAVTGYLRILVFPFHLHMGHDFRFFAFTDLPVIIGQIVTVFMILVAIVSLRRRPLLFWATAWFFITLLPVSNIFPTSFYMADHFLYLPSMGFFLAMAYLFTELYHRNVRCRKAAAGAFTAVFLFYAVLGFYQNDYWLTEKGFYERTLRYAPDNFRTHYNLGLALYKAGRYEEAISHYQTALRLKPDYVNAFVNLGVALAATGRYEEAIGRYQAALRLRPDNVDACNNLGVALYATGRYEEAIRYYQTALRLKPDDVEVYYNLGIAFYKTGQYDEAISHYLNAVRLRPDYGQALNNLGVALVAAERVEEAVGYYRAAVKIMPDNADFYSNLGKAFVIQGRYQEASACFERSLQINPDNIKTQQAYRECLKKN